MRLFILVDMVNFHDKATRVACASLAFEFCEISGNLTAIDPKTRRLIFSTQDAHYFRPVINGHPVKMIFDRISSDGNKVVVFLKATVGRR